eukprot:g6385.t1
MPIDNFILSPKKIEVNQSFYLFYRLPSQCFDRPLRKIHDGERKPSTDAYIGIYSPEQAKDELTGKRFYKVSADSDVELYWSSRYVPSKPGKYQFRFYDKGLLVGQSDLIVVEKGRGPHQFTSRFSSSNYKVTKLSQNVQSPFWPNYLTEDPTRFLVIERSKNASLVVRRMAYGINTVANSDGKSFSVKMVAASKIVGTLQLVDGKPKLILDVHGKKRILEKLYVKTKERFFNPIPSVEYVDLYGRNMDNGEMFSIRYDETFIEAQGK